MNTRCILNGNTCMYVPINRQARCRERAGDIILVLDAIPDIAGMKESQTLNEEFYKLNNRLIKHFIIQLMHNI